MLGLARSGYDVPDSYYQDYYATVETYVKACDGKLHDKKYTEYSRVIVALSSIGKDARNVGGYDLTKPLGDYDKTIWQGLNGPIWALIALDSRDYPMPENPGAETQATRQMYIDRILECQEPLRHPPETAYPTRTSQGWRCRRWPSIRISQQWQRRRRKRWRACPRSRTAKAVFPLGGLRIPRAVSRLS